MQNKPDFAITQFDIAIKQDPDFWEAYIARGDAYKKRGETKSNHAYRLKAQEDYSKAELIKEKKKF